jgi:hypothetical protein
MRNESLVSAGEGGSPWPVPARSWRDARLPFRYCTASPTGPASGRAATRTTSTCVSYTTICVPTGRHEERQPSLVYSGHMGDSSFRRDGEHFRPDGLSMRDPARLVTAEWSRTYGEASPRCLLRAHDAHLVDHRPACDRGRIQPHANRLAAGKLMCERLPEVAAARDRCGR